MKNRFDSLSSLWEGAWDQFNKRREYEFKYTIAVWTVFASFIALVITGSLLQAPGNIFVIIGAAVCFGLISFFHIIWIKGLGERNRRDRKIAIHYEGIMQELSDSKFPDELQKDVDGSRENMGKLSNWSHRVQVGITITLAIGCILAVIYSTNSPIKKKTEIEKCCCYINKASHYKN
jgi:amino acid transporter